MRWGGAGWDRGETNQGHFELYCSHIKAFQHDAEGEARYNGGLKSYALITREMRIVPVMD